MLSIDYDTRLRMLDLGVNERQAEDAYAAAVREGRGIDAAVWLEDWLDTNERYVHRLKLAASKERSRMAAAELRARGLNP